MFDNIYILSSNRLSLIMYFNIKYMKQVLTILMCISCLTTMGLAQSDDLITDDGEEIVTEDVQPEELEEGSTYNMWSDPLYYQFDKMMPELATSIGRLDTRISTVAVTELVFSPSLDESFRKVAAAKLYGQLLMENPKLKLIKCDECNMIRSEIKNGILTVSRGLASKDDRKKLANKIGVQGFMSAMVIEDERQLTIVVNVYDAEEGRIILSDVITGVPVPETSYWNFYMGRMALPVKLINPQETVEHSALYAGVEYSKRFAESWILATNFAYFMDNNSKLENKITLEGWFSFDGAAGYEFSFMNNDVAFAVMLGIGQFISAQFNFSIYYKVGLKTSINKMLTFNIYSLMFNATNLEAPDSSGNAPELTGSAQTITFGFQF